MKIFTCCGACSGKGKVFSEELTRTARVVPTRRAVSPKDVFAALGEAETGVGVTAINNRLTRLCDLGVIATAGKRGKAKLYQRVRLR